MKSVRMAFVVLAVAACGGWISSSYAQTAPSTGGITIPGVKVPQMPTIPQVPGMPQLPGTQQGAAGTNALSGSAATTAASMPKGQDAQWADQKCLNRGANNLGTCQDVCRNLGVTRASAQTEYSGICNY